MQSRTSFPLTNRQKWELGMGLAFIYVPLRVYMNVVQLDMPGFWHRLPLWTMEMLVSIAFFILWINVIEWLQYFTARFLGEDFPERFRLLDQIFTLLLAIALAMVFNHWFRFIWHWTEAVWIRQSFDVLPITFNDSPIPKKRANNSITVMALMAAYYLAANKRVYQRLQQVFINEERLEKENAKAHFNALKNQVSPHFLFNNFSVLTTLVETNQELSVQFINQLSRAYRYILEKSEYDSIKLSTELEFLETYMFLLTIRFENKLRLETHISATEADRYSIVPLTLQLLVENAVKHNCMSASKPLVIRIMLEGDYLSVSNPLQVRELPESSTRLGLQNIVNRYKLLTNKPVLVDKSDGYFTVKVPLIS
ncbi:sensor histidine kinase [Dyadobacter sp. MSC1_007]|jgi:two-component system LytT family sensor kinase|uniref:sensor histidine kinase n=1 Tax=Dyadobacter sp. MSC1_007 TaxID=2909264 RepID=UPI0020307217|nr:histidine kinase [Dyadobacter sp. MSC1_007]